MAVACLSGSGAACAAGAGKTPVISDSTFVEIMYALAQLRHRPDADSLTLVDQRRKTFELFNITPDDLEKKSLRLAEDPAHATAVWDKVRRKVATSGG